MKLHIIIIIFLLPESIKTFITLMKIYYFVAPFFFSGLNYSACVNRQLSLCSYDVFPYILVCDQISFSYKDTSHIGLEPT